jgi:putative protease
VTRVRTLHEGEGRMTQALRTDVLVPDGWVVVRSAHAGLLERARASFTALTADRPAPRMRLDVRASGTAGGRLTLTFAAEGTTVAVSSAIALQRATKHGLDVARLREQLGRLGETPYVLGGMDTSGLGDGLFLPVSVLNDLRQQAVGLLLARRGGHDHASHAVREGAIDAALTLAPAAAAPPRPALTAEVWRLEDARVAAEAGATEVSLDVFVRHPTPPVSRVRALADELRGRGVGFRLRTPTIVRPEERKVVDKWLALGTPLVSGHVGLVAELAGQGRDVVADYAVNCFNQVTAAELFRLGARRIVLSIELTGAEMAQVAAPWGGGGFEVFVYGRPEGMTIEHCVLSAAFDRGPFTCRDLCVQLHPHVELTDPAGYAFPVATDSACRNRLLHSRPVNGATYLDRLWRAGLRSYRLVFNVPGDPVADVTAAFRRMVDALAAGDAPDPDPIRGITEGAFTRGHFARAV